MKKMSLHILLIILIIAFMCIGYSQGFIEQKQIGLGFISLFGTYLGATFAFRLNEIKDSEKLKREKITALKRALFIMVRQINALMIYKIPMEKYNNDIEMQFKYSPSTPPNYDELKIDFASIAFLLDQDDPHFMLELSVEQDAFQQTITSIRVRNELFERLAREKIVSFHSKHPNIYTKNLLIQELGNRDFNLIQEASSTMISNIRECIIGNEILQGKIKEVARKLFPKEKFPTSIPPTEN